MTTSQKYTFNGKTLTLRQWSAQPEVRALGLAEFTLRTRLKSGWPITRALTEPSKGMDKPGWRGGHAAKMSIYLTHEAMEAAEKAALRLDRSISWVIQRCVELHAGELENLPTRKP